jgi:hypothetical protein
MLILEELLRQLAEQGAHFMTMEAAAAEYARRHPFKPSTGR